MPTVDPADPGATELLISTHGRRVERIWEPEIPLLDSTKKGLIKDCSMSDYESCGFIDTVQSYWFVPNVHHVPETNYLMDNQRAQDTIDLIYGNLGLEVLGIFHSHKNNLPWPSTRDLVGWPEPSILRWRYFVITDDDVIEWGLV